MSVDVSIIIPVYNNERSIARCLDSIINQKTNYIFEIIMVSDPCSDKTPDIIKTYIDNYKNIYNFNVSTRSVGLARQKGIEESKGQYLMFIDADDYYKENAVNLMVSTIQKTNADVVAASFYYVRNKKVRKNFFSKNATYNKQGMIKALMQDSYMHGFMWNKIYKSSLLKEYNYPLPSGNIIREDVLTNFQIFLNANKLVMLSKPIYYYDKTYESTTSAKDKTRIPWFLTIFATERFLLEDGYPQYLEMFYSLKNRRKLLIWGDQQIIKSGYTKEEFKILKSDCKKYLAILNNKDQFMIEAMPWQNFIEKLKEQKKDA